MGNSASTPANGRPIQQRRTQSPSPSPGAPHRSLRTKKKSLELPDLASLSLTSNATPPARPKTASIPIPGSPAALAAATQERGRPAPPITAFNSDDLLNAAVSSTGPYGIAGGSTPYYRQQQQQQQRAQQTQRIQELYNQSNVPAAPAPEPKPAPKAADPGKEVVRSSIPVALDPKSRMEAAMRRVPPVPTKITWYGGGHSVILARAGHDEWRGRTKMIQESAGSLNFSVTVDLPPGTHHIRFLVDDQWVVSTDIPSAVDDQGSLANYVTVPFTLPKGKDPSFFVDSEPTPSPPRDRNAVPNPGQTENWTNVIPPELTEAFKEEEMYLAANQGHLDPHTGHHHTRGFVPAPNIPPAPALPRHLDKLILNMRVSPGPAASAVGNSVAPVGSAASVVTGVGSGQGSTGRGSRRTRENREERRERKGRDRGYSDVTGSRRGMYPPPPPPPTEIDEFGPSTVDAILADSIPTTVVEDVPLVTGGSPTTVASNHSNPFARPTSPSTSTSLSASTDTTAATTPTSANTPVSSPPPPPPPTARTITIDAANMPSLTDDASVLPVPSHVVLHHLCTSAIKNGVLAVASTTRYRQKYLTTIYYKPT